MLSVYDVPANFITCLSTGALKRILHQLTIPHKLHLSVVNKLCGVLKVPPPAIPLNNGEYTSSPGEGIDKVTTLGDEGGSREGSKGGSKEGSRGQAQSSLPSNWLENVVHNKDESAAKAEDSEIPIHLWDDVLGHQLSVSINNRHRRALAILRRWSIRLWKRRVTRSFTHWFRCATCNGSYECLSCAKYLVKQRQGKSIVSFTRGGYAWASAGRKAYSKWRHIYF